MDATIPDRRYLAPAVASPFSFPVQEILGQCNTNLACEFDQTIIFRPTTPPIKRKMKNKVWLARLGYLYPVAINIIVMILDLLLS